MIPVKKGSEKVEGKENKTTNILIRVSPTEKKKIEEKAALAKMSVAAYLLELSETKRIVDTSKLPSLILEINRIGVNINQIAAVANTQKYVSKDTLLHVIDKQNEIVGLLRKILSEVYDEEEHSIQSLETKIDKLIKTVQVNDSGGGGDDGSC
jgi:hypothetical protein